MVPRLVPEILSKCAFCDGAGAAGAAAGIGDSRILIVTVAVAALQILEAALQILGAVLQTLQSIVCRW